LQQLQPPSRKIAKTGKADAEADTERDGVSCSNGRYLRGKRLEADTADTDFALIAAVRA